MAIQTSKEAIRIYRVRALQAVAAEVLALATGLQDKESEGDESEDASEHGDG